PGGDDKPRSSSNNSQSRRPTSGLRDGCVHKKSKFAARPESDQRRYDECREADASLFHPLVRPATARERLCQPSWRAPPTGMALSARQGWKCTMQNDIILFFALSYESRTTIA